MVPTRFYSDCLGVFQGGGCRAAAFAGAYEAAYEHGVRFSEVAGTSAGSIVAALIAAGAEPDYLLNKLRQLDFQHLIEIPARSIFDNPSVLARIFSYLAPNNTLIKVISRAVAFGGVYSSQPIESWIESCLKELLEISDRPILFRDLPIPLHIVAGDLHTMGPHVWSHQRTPDYRVAHAVRASCSLPMFFQPVEEGTALLVDGGIVGNLPLFVLAHQHPQRRNQPTERPLLFMLESSEDRSKASGFLSLLQQLASLSVDAGTEVQLGYVPTAARILIPTGSIRATDFSDMTPEKKEELIDNGRRAARSFIEAEGQSAISSSINDHVAFDAHEALVFVTRQATAVQTEVVVSLPETRWFWELFPTVYQWLSRNVRVICLVGALPSSPVGEAQERQRRLLMAQFGIVIHEVERLPFTGYLFDRDSSTGSAIVYASDHGDYEPLARHYFDRADATVLQALNSMISGSIPNATPTNVPGPLERLDPNVVIELLRQGIPFYRDQGVSLELADIEISKVFLISRFVRAYRYAQIASLSVKFELSGLNLFEAAKIHLNRDTYSIVTPPVVEASGESYVALEGNTRFLHSHNHGIRTVKGIVVRGVRTELPGTPTALKYVRITGRIHAPEERIKGFNHGLFRAVERSMRPL